MPIVLSLSMHSVEWYNACFDVANSICSVLCIQGRNCLHVAICEGHVGIVSELLAKGLCELTRMEVRTHTSLHGSVHA